MKPSGSKERVFIALFNYDPSCMSPNVESCHEELTLHENQLGKVFGDQDEDGFYFGEFDGKTGYIPSTYVAEVQMDEPNDAQVEKPLVNAKNRKKQAEKPKFFLMVALYDYDPYALSPNTDSDVS
jgi:RIMS-binding protein 2